jgi:hypothetical protein
VGAGRDEGAAGLPQSAREFVESLPHKSGRGGTQVVRVDADELEAAVERLIRDHREAGRNELAGEVAIWLEPVLDQVATQSTPDEGIATG